MLISVFSIILSGFSSLWYVSTLQPFLKTNYNLNHGQAGLVYFIFSTVYTLSMPVFGFCIDRGLDTFLAVVIGHVLMAVGYVFMAPVPQLSAIMDGHLWSTAVAIGAVV